MRAQLSNGPGSAHRQQRARPARGRSQVRASHARGGSSDHPHDLDHVGEAKALDPMPYQGRIVAYGPPAELRASHDPHVQRFIHAGSVDVH